MESMPLWVERSAVTMVMGMAGARGSGDVASGDADSGGVGFACEEGDAVWVSQLVWGDRDDHCRSCTACRRGDVADLGFEDVVEELLQLCGDFG